MFLFAFIPTALSNLELQTPALLFPALSLLMLAYTNKFLAIAKLIRNLYSDYQKNKDHRIIRQISSLRRRLNLIRWMQACGVGSIFMCVVSMFSIYGQHTNAAKVSFGLALLLLLVSLVMSVIEIFLSAGALNVLLRDLEEKK
jgi:Protein of unknown function (DUF2721)